VLEVLEKRLSEPSLREAFYKMLRTKGFDVPEDVSVETLEEDEASRDQLMKALLPLYEDPEGNLPLNLLTESLVSLDQKLALWREHHVRVVERIIGHRRGTGGSSGVGYLRSTTSKQAFPYLLELRTILAPQPGVVA
jgi:tryptophan 2,3-dioxygenase